MARDRSWVQLDDHRLEPYRQGCVEFLDFAFRHAAIDGNIKCPCKDCMNKKFGDRELVHQHLLWRGMYKAYGEGLWILHNERVEDNNHEDEVPKRNESEKGPWGLPDNDTARKWFNVKARNRWSDFKTRTLKPYFDNAEGDLQKAIANRPMKHINEPMWETLCKQFAGINDPGEDPNGKSKSQKCKEARGANSMNHSLGRTSLENWVDEHIQVLGKPPNVGVVFDKAYLRIDPLQPRSSQSDEGEEGSQSNSGVTRNPVVREFSENLHKCYNDAIADGSNESNANTEAARKVFGQSMRCLGLDSLKANKQRSKRAYSSTQGEMEALKEQVAVEKKKREALELSLGSIMAYLQQQGFQPPNEHHIESHGDHSTNSNDHTIESNEAGD